MSAGGGCDFARRVENNILTSADEGSGPVEAIDVERARARDCVPRARPTPSRRAEPARISAPRFTEISWQISFSHSSGLRSYLTWSIIRTTGA